MLDGINLSMMERINIHLDKLFECWGYLLLDAIGIQLGAERIEYSQLLPQFNNSRNTINI
jgi:hypothetical protein